MQEKQRVALWLSVALKATGHHKDECKPVVDYKPACFDLNSEADVARLRETMTTRNTAPWFYHGGKRNAENAKAMSAVCLDFDDGTALETLVAEFGGFYGIIHTTTRATAEHPKWRVILALQKAITDRAVYEAACEWLTARYPHCDAKACKVAQNYYPCCAHYRNESGADVASWGFAHFQMHLLQGSAFFAFPSSMPPVERVTVSSSPRPSESDWLEVDDRFYSANRRRLDYLLTHADLCGYPHGERDHELYIRTVACYFADVGEDEAIELLTEWDSHNVPPLMDEDRHYIRDKVRYVYREKPPDTGHGLGTPSIARADRLMRESGPTSAVQPGPEETTPENSGEPAANKRLRGLALRSSLLGTLPCLSHAGFRGYELVDLARVAPFFVPAEELMPLCWRGENTRLCGNASEGKSTMLRSWCADAARDGKRILWITAESENKAMIWWEKMGLEPGIIVCDARDWEDIPDIGPERWAALHAYIELAKPDIIILDSLTSIQPYLAGGSIEAWKGPEVRAFIKAIGALAKEHDAGIIVVHHFNKSGEAEGAEIMKAEFDNTYDMRKNPNNADQRILKRTKSRYVHTEGFVCEGGPKQSFRYVMVDASEAATLIPAQAKRLLELYRQNEYAMTYSDITAAGIAESTARDYFRAWGIKQDRKSKKWSIPAEIVRLALDEGILPVKVASVKKAINKRGNK